VNAESRPKAAPQVRACQRDHEQSNAAMRAAALATDAAAIAEGVWPASPEILDALSSLAHAVEWDLALAGVR
jgi:hypothetical protein